MRCRPRVCSGTAQPDGGGTIAALTAIPGAVAAPNFAALGIGVLSLVMIFMAAGLGRYLPGPLAALIVGTIVATFFDGVPILGDIPTGLPSLVVPEFTQSTFLIVLEAAFILALLGAIDSLLTSLVADNMTRTRHDSNKELIGQGIGNTVSGLFGAIPGAGATMRTVVNIRTGGATKISGMLHSVLLLAVVISLSPLASMIPHAVLAGILVKVGWDIIDVAYIRHAHKGPRWDLVLMALVLGLTVFVDLITAVALGVVLGALAFVKRLADEQLARVDVASADDATDPEEKAILEQAKGSILLFDFFGPLSFGAAADLGHQVREKTREGASAIVLDFSSASHFDVSAARAVETIANDDARAAGKSIYLCAVSDDVRATLVGLKLDENLPEEVYLASRLDGLRAALRVIQGTGPEPDEDAPAAAPA